MKLRDLRKIKSVPPRSEQSRGSREQPVSYVKARTTVYYLRARYVSESSLQCCVSCVGGSGSLQWLGVTVVPMFLFAWIGNCEWRREHLTSAALPGDERSTRCSWTQPKGAVDMIRGPGWALTFWKKSSPPLTLPSEAAARKQGWGGEKKRQN